jgi:predicted phosphodiesterase
VGQPDHVAQETDVQPEPVAPTANQLVSARSPGQGGRMTDRVAVLADVHCVLPAFEAVLAEPDVRSADVIVLAGDLAVGPQPVETFDLVSSLGERVVWVRGNCERETLAWARGAPAPADPHLAVGVWAARALRPDQVELLDGLPQTVTLDVRGLGAVLFCHATPRDDEEFVLVDSGLERWSEVLSGVAEPVRTVVCGHTHMPYVRLVDGTTVVNPGSVGMPYGSTGAHWALLGGADGPAIQLRRTELDAEALGAALVAGSGFPGIQDWVDAYVHNPPSDIEALAAFRPKTI